MTNGASPETHNFDNDDLLSGASLNDDSLQEKSSREMMRIAPRYEDVGKYLIKLSGHILTNLDGIYDSLDETYKEGHWEYKRDLETTCGPMAAAGAWIWGNEHAIERDIGAGPAFVKGQIVDGSFVVQEIDWEELALFMKREGYDYINKFKETDGFQGSAFEGDPTSLQIIGEFILEQSYDSSLPFLPNEVSLSVKTIS